MSNLVGKTVRVLGWSQAMTVVDVVGEAEFDLVQNGSRSTPQRLRLVWFDASNVMHELVALDIAIEVLQRAQQAGSAETRIVFGEGGAMADEVGDE